MNDIDNWREVVARCLTMAGISNNDIAQVSYGYGLFTGGLGVHYGLEKVGASVVPISGGNTRRQLQLMNYTSSSEGETDDAVVLFDKGTSRFVTQDNGFELMFERETRIKIQTEAGIKLAEIEIPVYKGKDDLEKVTDFEAKVYNMRPTTRSMREEQAAQCMVLFIN